MTKQEKHVLKKIMEIIPEITVQGPSYDENFKQISSGDDLSLMEDPKYRLAWERCAAQACMYLDLLLTGTKEDYIKFAGKEK